MKNLGILIIAMVCSSISYAQNQVISKQKVINNETLNSFESPRNLVNEFPNENSSFIENLNQVPLNQPIPGNINGNRLIVYPASTSSAELTKLNAIISANPQLRVINKSTVDINNDGPALILLPTEPIAPINNPDLAPVEQQ